MLAVDENGKLIDGDQIMAACAKFMRDNGTLKQNTLVATVMSNLGLFMAGEKIGINIPRTKVGDRYVLEERVTISAVNNPVTSFSLTTTQQVTVL